MSDPAGGERRGGTLRRVSGNTGAQAVSDVVAKLAVLLTYAVVARELGTVPVGQLTLAVSLSILLVLAGLGTDPLLGREIARDPGTIKHLLWHVLGIKLIFAAIAMVAIVLVTVIGGFSAELQLTVILIAVSSAIDLIGSTFAWVLRGREEMVPVGAGSILQRITLTVIAVGAILALDGGIVAVGIAYVAGSLVGAGYLARQLFTRRLWPAAAFSPRQALQVAIDSLPLAASGVLSTLLARLDALILAAMATLTAVGIYGAAYRLIEGTFFIGWAFGAAMFPMLSRLEKDSQPSLNRVFSLGARISLAGMFPAGAVFIVFPAPLIDLVYGSQFDAAVVTTRWLGLVAAVNGLASFGIFALLARNLKGAMVRSCGLALVVNVILNLALIPLYGANGAAIAMAAANVVLAAVALGIAIRHIGPVSGVRMAALTAFPFALMAGTRMLIGETWPGLIVGLAAYGVGLLLAHHWLFRGDTHIVRDWIRTRRLGTAEA